MGAVVHLAYGERARAEGDLRSAVGCFELAVEILGDSTRSAWLANAHLLLADVLHSLGDTPGMMARLDAADAILDHLPDPGTLPCRSALLRLRASTARHVTEFGEALSERERSVLLLVSDGLTQREIADQLYISYNTVKSHLKATYRKLGATSRDDARPVLPSWRPNAMRHNAPGHPGEPRGGWRKALTM